MLRRVRSLAGFALLAAVALGAPAAVRAQTPQWYDGHVSLSGGVSLFDRSGTGTMAIYALRADMPIYPNLLVEAGLSYARRGHDPDFGDLFIPGLQLQLQAITEHFNPYLGMGAGITVERRDGPVEDDLSFAPSFSAGVRIAIADGVGAAHGRAPARSRRELPRRVLGAHRRTQRVVVSDRAAVVRS